MTDTILTVVTDATMTITLNRPEKLNAFNAQMSLDLASALSAAADPAIRVVLITGAGKGFCAGQDLGDRMIGEGAAPIDLGHTIETYWNPIVRAIANLEKPVVAAVNGVAAGAGANVALACDIVLAARSAKFIEPFCRLGLVPDAGGSYHIPRLVGLARAKGMTMLGEPVTAEQAATWGLIWKVVEDAVLMSEAATLAKSLSQQPTYGLSLIKQALQASLGNTLDDQLDLERDLQRQAGQTPDYREGVSAFMDKRKPVFTGKRRN